MTQGPENHSENTVRQTLEMNNALWAVLKMTCLMVSC